MSSDTSAESPHGAGDTGKKSGTRRHRLRWVLIPAAVVLILASVLWTSYLAVSGRPITLPNWVSETAESRINAALDGPRITLEDVEITWRRSGLPRLRLRDVGIFDAAGQEIARLNEVGARLDRAAIFKRELRPRSLSLSGAQITLRRRADGTFDVSLGSGLQASGTLSGVLDSIDAAFARQPLDLIERIEADEVTILLEDARSRRVWQVTGGRLTLDQGSEMIDLNVTAEVFNGTEDLAGLSLGFRSDKTSSEASLTAQFDNAAAFDIAAQAPVLSFMRVLDAPISGALRTTLGPEGALETLAGALEIGAGNLDATEGAEPVGFAGGRVYFDYDPLRQRIDFSEISVETDLLEASAGGHAYLREFNQAIPGALLGQVALERMDVEPAGVFATPLFFDDGAVDFRLRLNPFTLEIGQAVLIDEELRIDGAGQVSASSEGWAADIDIHVAEAMPRRVLSFWPIEFAPRTRDWLMSNIRGGMVKGADAAVRLRPGQAPRVSTTFDFEDARVRFLPEMPEILGGAGFVFVDEKRFSLSLEDGTLTPPGAAPVTVTGSTLKVDDTDLSPSIMQVSLRTESSIPSALALMDQPPLRIMSRAGRPTDLADGRASLTTDLVFPLINDLTLSDVAFETTGTLHDLRSDKLVAGRSLAAEELGVSAGKDAVRISGRARLDGVPVTLAWTQPVEDEAAPTTIDGSLSLSADALQSLGIPLPEGTVTGEGLGQFSVELAEGRDPRFSLVSDLRGIGLSIPALRWQLPEGGTGRLEMRGTLGASPVVETFEIVAAGLSAQGDLTVSQDGGLALARIERLRVGTWLDVSAELAGRGEGLPPQIRIDGGTVDLRALQDAPATQSTGTGDATAAGGAAQDVPLQVTLDRLIVSDGITLTSLNGSFTTARGIDGSFGARVNGDVPLSGRVVPENGRSAIRLTSADGGGVMRAAGVIPNFRGGDMTLTLRPDPAREGTYSGNLDVRNTRVVEAPAMTELLSAISVVGLIEQMGGTGIGMDMVDADFVLTPTQVQLLRSSATGPSLGITLSGVYQLATGAMQMQGVVSPVYFLNSIGQIFTRQGEGLFGFNYTLSSNGQETQVGVNPLSILTPGMFRDIFRRPPPT